jgi:hypothetical protein
MLNNTIISCRHETCDGEFYLDLKFKFKRYSLWKIDLDRIILIFKFV